MEALSWWAGLSTLLVAPLLVGCGDSTSSVGGAGHGGDGTGAADNSGGDGTGGAAAGGGGTGGAAAAGGNGAGGAATGGSDTGGAGGGVIGCADFVVSCLAASGVCIDYGVGGNTADFCIDSGFVPLEESCVTRADADVGAGCFWPSPPFCSVTWYPVSAEEDYPNFEQQCENSGQTWIVL